MVELSDAEFTLRLRLHLGQSEYGQRPIVALIRNPDGSINRDATLALPCYQNLKDTMLTSAAGATLEK